MRNIIQGQARNYILMNELDRLLLIMKSLRDPEEGCPWDKVQTIDSIKGYTLEEAYEVVDAIERNDIDGLKDELGDLLFHIIFYSEMADEEGHFNFQEVVAQLIQKLERRHPHVFANARADTIEDVKTLWKEIKQQERVAILDKEDKTTLLGDIEKHMPAMQRAEKLQRRAANVGFDWENSRDILHKLDEELSELREAAFETNNIKHISEELGDLMFCCINLARHYQIDPELALRNTNEKFISRFNYIETMLDKQDKTLEDASLEEMDQLWDAAKLNLK